MRYELTPRFCRELGTMSDVALAARHLVSRNFVFRTRTNLGIPAYKRPRQRPGQEAVIALVVAHPGLTGTAIAHHRGVSREAVRQILHRLAAQGQIRGTRLREGVRRIRRWYPVSSRGRDGSRD